jgi:hypothetical protein
MRIESLPGTAPIKSDFGEMKVDYSMSGNILLATFTLTYTQSRIPPEQYAAFRDFLNSCLRAEMLRLRVVKTTQ